MKSKDWHAAGLTERDCTPEDLYMSRRRWLASVGAAAASILAPKLALAASKFDTTEQQTPFEDVTHYNNFYELATDKLSPARLAEKFKTRPWTVRVDGLCKKPRTWDADALLKKFPAEQRVYRFRCVEAWSMVVPWDGFPLSKLIKEADPLPTARFVEFTTAADKSFMPGLSYPALDWPYREGLRLDEAMHPLTLVVSGLYGKPLPGQNGAPLRLIVPWKYGFKGAKSLVRIRFTARQPATAWNTAAPDEYGFYSNVNPRKDHPRWSQSKERRLGELFRRNTLMFNGYEDQVASLYKGMDLDTNF
jgi:sulfoxide reductase catalytic subunit YedY